MFPYGFSGEPFFTATDLANRLQIDPDNINSGLATLLAQLASDAVRADLWLTVDYVENDTVTLWGDFGSVLVLPERPVTAVSAVTVGGEALTALPTYPVDYSSAVNYFDWRPDGRLLRIVYPGTYYASALSWYWPSGVPVQVTYSHGWQTVPSPFKQVALELAAGAYSSPELQDSGRVGFVEWSSKHISLDLNCDQRRSLDYYRRLSI